MVKVLDDPCNSLLMRFRESVRRCVYTRIELSKVRTLSAEKSLVIYFAANAAMS